MIFYSVLSKIDVVWSGVFMRPKRIICTHVFSINSFDSTPILNELVVKAKGHVNIRVSVLKKANKMHHNCFSFAEMIRF